MDITNIIDRRKTATNSTYKKLAVQWLSEALYFVGNSVLTDRFVLQKRQLLVAANRWLQLNLKLNNKHSEPQRYLYYGKIEKRQL